MSIQDIFRLGFDLEELDDVINIGYYGEESFQQFDNPYAQLNTTLSNQFVYIDNFYKYPERVREFWENQEKHCGYNNDFDDGSNWDPNNIFSQLPFTVPAAPGCRYISSAQTRRKEDSEYKPGTPPTAVNIWEENLPELEAVNAIQKILEDYFITKELVKKGATRANFHHNVDFYKTEIEITTHRRHANEFQEDDIIDPAKLLFSMKQPHRDSSKFAWLVGLTDDEDSVGGTGFFKHKETNTYDYRACLAHQREKYGEIGIPHKLNGQR